MNRFRQPFHRVWDRLAASALVQRGRDLEADAPCLGFATLALVTLAPLLIVVAAFNPWGRAAGSPPGWPTAWAVGRSAQC